MKISTISLFPEIFQALDYSIPGRAAKAGLLELKHWQLRDFALDKHRTVDDRPFGGGPGMVLKVEPLRAAIKAAREAAPLGSPVVYLSPQGTPFNQQLAEQQLKLPGLILIAGRYEGIDERVLEHDVDLEWSVGDYVLSGGEFAALSVIDAVTRLIPGALGDLESALQESFTTGLLDHPHYTRPEEIDGQRVPEVLLGGNHADIEHWRHEQALKRTKTKRPDLLNNGLDQSP